MAFKCRTNVWKTGGARLQAAAPRVRGVSLIIYMGGPPEGRLSHSLSKMFRLMRWCTAARLQLFHGPSSVAPAVAADGPPQQKHQRCTSGSSSKTREGSGRIVSSGGKYRHSQPTQPAQQMHKHTYTHAGRMPQSSIGLPPVPLCKAKRQHLLTCKVSRYCLLALHGRSSSTLAAARSNRVGEGGAGIKRGLLNSGHGCSLSRKATGETLEHCRTQFTPLWS